MIVFDGEVLFSRLTKNGAPDDSAKDAEESAATLARATRTKTASKRLRVNAKRVLCKMRRLVIDERMARFFMGPSLFYVLSGFTCGKVLVSLGVSDLIVNRRCKFSGNSPSAI